MVAETVEQHDELTAGRRLQAAREERKIERSEVARWLKLDEKFIKAIEEDDEEHLPQPVFIAGYIRSYAKLVNLPPDQLVEEFTKTHGISSPKITRLPEPVPGRMGKVAESLPRHFRVAAESYTANAKKFVLASAATLVLVVVGGIAVFMGEKDNEIVALDSQPMEAVTAVAPETIPSASDQQASSAATPSGDATASSQAATSAPTPEEAVVPERITVPLELRKLERGDPGFVASLDEGGLSTYADLPKETIEIRFSADSWVDIRDATGRRIIRSMGVAGATKEVQGVAPFQVLIGYGPGVQMIYNGQPFDFSKYQGKQEVARFTLNAPEKTKQPSQ